MCSSDLSCVIQESAHEDANIIFGAVVDPNLSGKVKITVIATGFERGPAENGLLRPSVMRQAPSGYQTPVDMSNYASLRQPAEPAQTQAPAPAAAVGQSGVAFVSPSELPRQATGTAPASGTLPRRAPLDLSLTAAPAEPVDEATLESPWLVAPNRALAAYAAWHRWIDVWVVLRARDPEYVLTWRVEAEEKMKASGKPGLSRADIEDYIRRFLPAYRTWGGAPRATPDDRCLEFTINLDRSVNRSR